MDKVVDRYSNVDFYDTCLLASDENLFLIGIGFTTAGEYGEEGIDLDPDDFDSEDKYEEAYEAALEEMELIYGTLNITLSKSGSLVDYDYYTD